MKQLFLFSLAAMLLTFTACTKTAPLIAKDDMAVDNLQSSDLKEAGKRPKKGFSAKINRSKWVSNGLQSDSTPIPGAAYYGTFGIDNSLVLVGYGSFAGFENASYAYILLFVNNFNGPGVYPMGEFRGVNSFGVFTSVYEDGSFDQFYSGVNSGTLNITSYDETNQTISGDFNFSAASSTDSSSIIVRDGVFGGLQLQ